MNKQRTMIGMAITSVLLTTGCSFASDKASTGFEYLPEPIGDRAFLTGWLTKEDNLSAKLVHAELEARYIKAATTAASGMGWELEKLLVTNASNVSTTSDPAEFRSTTVYGVHAPGIGCEIETRDNGRTVTNCKIKIFAGGLQTSETPEGVLIPARKAWAFDQSENHTIALQGNDDADLPQSTFAQKVSANLPDAVFLYIPANHGQWFHQGKPIAE